jgi:hypothetical protein
VLHDSPFKSRTDTDGPLRPIDAETRFPRRPMLGPDWLTPKDRCPEVGPDATLDDGRRRLHGQVRAYDSPLARPAADLQRSIDRRDAVAETLQA